MKHLVNLILLILGILFPLELFSFSEDHVYVNGIYYIFNENIATVTNRVYGNDPNYSGNIVIPETVSYGGKTYTVTSIGNGAFRYTPITGVVIPNTIYGIGEGAFANCDQLTEVVLPYSVEGIGQGAFRDCDNLKTIVIPSNITGISQFSFFNSALEDIYCYPAMPSNIYLEYDRIFNDYTATLHVPATSLAAYFIAPVWCDFENIVGDAIEPTSISISKDSIGIYLDHQFQLNATIIPANTTTPDIVWISTNTYIATVEDGLVSAIGLGECDIIAYSLYGYKAICHVTIAEETAVITLDQHEASVLPNHILTLIPTVTPPSTDLSVSSSDPTVAAARVVNGKVQVVGIKEGTTTIMVNVANGNGQPDSCLVTVYTEVGDVNCDGFVNMDDLAKLINYLLTDDESLIKAENADVNLSGAVNMDDLATLINYLLTDKWPWHHDPNDYVDLGLHSGTLWATMNIGANAPEEYGDYFAWGETAPKDNYNWSTYKWCNGSEYTMTKYCLDWYYGYNSFTDGKTELESEDDAAYVNWGQVWRMPTYDQQIELRSECTWTETTLNGVNGQLVTGPNGKSIFLPAAGYRWNKSLHDAGSKGLYWSRTLFWSNQSYLARILGGSSECLDRLAGCPVRAVRVSQN